MLVKYTLLLHDPETNTDEILPFHPQSEKGALKQVKKQENNNPKDLFKVKRITTEVIYRTRRDPVYSAKKIRWDEDMTLIPGAVLHGGIGDVLYVIHKPPSPALLKWERYTNEELDKPEKVGFTPTMEEAIDACNRDWFTYYLAPYLE